MRNIWPKFPNVVGCIDITPHEILIPSIQPQRNFYSGHRHFHLLNTQMVCDNTLDFSMQAGFLGSTHESQSLRLMQPVGPGLGLDVPAGVVFLSDKGHSDVPQLLTPFRQNQIRRMRLTNREKRKARRFNRELSRKRVTGIWRQERWLLPVVIRIVHISYWTPYFFIRFIQDLQQRSNSLDKAVM